MSSNLITQPYPIILNPFGGGGSAKPAANAEFHVGEIDKDPVQFPRTDLAYKDEEGNERLITSPIYTNNSGAFVASKNSGTIIQPYMKDGVGYSVLITGRRGVIHSSKHVGDPGNLAEAISDYTDLVFDSVPLLQASSPASNLARTISFWTIGDGGAEWRKDGSTGTPNKIDPALGKIYDSSGNGWIYVLSAALVAKSILELATFVGFVDGQKAFLSANGRSGDFTWSSSDLTNEVSGDTLQGLYVAPNSDPTGASGAWVRILKGFITPEMFGATGDGIVDDAAPWQAALDAKGTIVAEGRYRIGSTLVVDSDTTVELRSGSVVSKDFNGTLFSSKALEDGNTTYTQSNVSFSGGGAITVNSGANTGKQFALWWIEGLTIRDIQILDYRGDWAMSINGNNVVIDNLNIKTLNGIVSEDGVHIRGGKNIKVSNCTVVSGDDCFAVTAETVATSPPIQDVVFENCTGTSLAASGIKVTHLDPAATSIKNVTFRDITIESAIDFGARIDVASGFGSVSGITFNNVKLLDGSGVLNNFIRVEDVQGVRIINCECDTSTNRNVQIVGCTNAEIIGGKYSSPTGVSQANIFVNNCTEFHISGVQLDSPTFFGITCTGTPSITGGSIRDCFFTNMSTLACIDINNGSGVVVTGNDCRNASIGIQLRGGTDSCTVTNNFLVGVSNKIEDTATGTNTIERNAGVP